MSNYLGDFKASSSVNFNFTTHAAAGGAVAPSSAFEAADLIIYKGSSAVQRSSASGITMTSPFDSIVGLHHVAIDLSDNTDAGFWVAGSDYFVILSPDETVDSQTVVKEVASFSIENRVVNWAQVVSPTTTVGLSGTTVKTATDVETDTADIQTRIPAALSGGNMKTDVLAISGDTTAADNAESFFDGTGYAGTNNVIPTVANTGTLAGAATVVLTDGTLTAAKFGAGAIDAAALATDAVAEIQSGLATSTQATSILTRLLGAIPSNGTIGTGNSTTSIVLPAVTGSANDDLNNWGLVLYDNSATRYYYTLIRDWTASTTAATVDTLPFTPENSVDLYWLLPVVSGINVSRVGGTDQAAGVDMPSLASGANGFAAIKTVVDDIPTNAELVTALGTADDAVLARLGTPAGASVSADIAAVKTDTGNLVTRITSTLFSGMTSLAEWLGLIATKKVGNTTARTELNATGAGSGTYSETTDSTEAIRDRGDAAWITGAGGGDTVIVAPIVATQPVTTITMSASVQAFQYCALPAGPITIVDAAGDPVNLASDEVKMICTRNTLPETTFTLVEVTHLTIGGASSNQITVNYVPTVAGKYIRRTFAKASGGNWRTIEIGSWDIQEGPNPDA